jgi:hypothetical protein
MRSIAATFNAAASWLPALWLISVHIQQVVVNKGRIRGDD